MRRIAVFASGRGSNLERLLSLSRQGKLEAEIVLVAVDRPCRAAELAEQAGIEVFSASARAIGMPSWEQQCLRRLCDFGIEILVLAGFMRILSPEFVGYFPGRILNLHPSLLPAFPGKDAIEQALRYGVRVTGITVHFVDETLDGGPVVLQEAVAVLADDDESSLGARIHEVEHRLLPEAIRLLAQGRLRSEGRQVTILEG